MRQLAAWVLLVARDGFVCKGLFAQRFFLSSRVAHWKGFGHRFGEEAVSSSRKNCVWSDDIVTVNQDL